MAAPKTKKILRQYFSRGGLIAAVAAVNLILPQPALSQSELPQSVISDAPAADAASPAKEDSYNKAERKKKDEAVAKTVSENKIENQKDSDSVKSEILQSDAITAVTPAVEQKPVSEPVANEPAVKMQSLPEPAMDSAGLSDRGISLGSDMWQNTSHGLAIRLIAGLPNELTSPALRQLASRLLLTAAQQPKKDKSMELGDQLLIEQRFAKLWNMGQWDAYASLLAAMPAAAVKGNLAKNHAMMQLMTKQSKLGCDRIDKSARAGETDAFWHKAQIYCAIADNKPDAARLMHDVWREKNTEADADLDVLVEAAAGSNKKTKLKAKNLTGIHWLIVRDSGIVISPEGFDGNADQAVSYIAAGSNILPLDKKIELAEKLAQHGAMDGVQLSGIYDQLPRSGQDGQNILLKDTAKIPSAVRRALNWAYLNGLEENTQRATSIADLYDAFAAPNERRLLAIANLSWLKTLPASPELQWFSPYAARLLVWGGDLKSARSWFELALVNETTAVKSWPYLRVLRIVDSNSPKSRVIAEKWVAQTMMASPRMVEQWLGSTAMLSRALGDSEEVFARSLMPKGFSADMLRLRDMKTASPGLSVVMQQAVQGGSRGELAAYAIYSLGQSGLSEIAVQNLAQAIDNLNRLGIPDEAKSLALEFLAESGA